MYSWDNMMFGKKHQHEDKCEKHCKKHDKKEDKKHDHKCEKKEDKKNDHKKDHHEKKKYVFSNPSTILVPGGPFQGQSTPYPSSLIVSGVEKEIKNISVTIHNINHGREFDLHLLLVSPSGESVYLLGQVGGFNPVTNVTLTFDDKAPYNLQANSPLRSGSFKPSVIVKLPVFPGPPQYTTLKGLENQDPNGVWQLFVWDQFIGATGTIAGWSLNIETK